MEQQHAPAISEEHRSDLRVRLAESFHSLLFHREGYRPCAVPAELVEQIASVVEAKAFLHVVRAAELGMSARQVVATYAKEASTLLLGEVERYCLPLEAPRSGPAGLSTPGASVDLQQLSLNEFSGGLRSIQTAPSNQRQPSRHRDAAWGWLVPGSRMLPYVVLKGAGVAIGRGKEALWAIGGASAAGTPRSCLLAGTGDRHLTEVLKRNLGFVEVADGRVSRLHCIISLAPAAGHCAAPASAAGQQQPGSGGAGGQQQQPSRQQQPQQQQQQQQQQQEQVQQVVLEDCSSNGTFLNHRKLTKGESVALEDGDRISLVLSVAPLVEQYFTYRSVDPRDPELGGSDEHSWVGSTHSTAGAVFSPGAVNSGSPLASLSAGSTIFRTATSRYTTAEQSTLEDLKCQICLTTLRQCVALEPCGHNFCATCLSHHLGNQLQSGLQLSCPFRCPPPERIIINYAVRALIDLLGSSGRSLSSHMPSRAGSSGVTATALGAAGSGLPRSSSRAGAPLQSAFGVASGSHTSLSGLGAASPPGAGGGSSDATPQRQAAAAAAASPPAASSSGAMARVASAASAASLEGGAGEGGGARSSRHVGSAAPRNAAAATDMLRAESGDPDYFTASMSMLCPLDDEHLPMEAANLKTRQVEVALAQLKDSALPLDDHLVCLEALARLAWSDDGVRQVVANSGGVRSLVDVMALHTGSDSIQCNGCLALMSLVRGEGEVCQSNQWHIAKAGAIEVIAQAMQRFRDNAMVQLSVLLCLIPLALENAMMQAHITQECLGHIMAALDGHADEVDIQTKGLVLLGVLIQGDDAVHDAVRMRQLEAAVPRRVAAALRLHGRGNDDVLWAALFVLAVLVRDSSSVFARAAGACVRARVFPVLEAAVEDYKSRHADENLEPDEMIVSAGDYLLRVLEPVQQQHDTRRLLLAGAAGVAVGAAAVLLLRRLWGGSDAGATSGGGSASVSSSSSASGLARSTGAP